MIQGGLVAEALSIRASESQSSRRGLRTLSFRSDTQFVDPEGAVLPPSALRFRRDAEQIRDITPPPTKMYWQ
jgi:hypothetical protein